MSRSASTDVECSQVLRQVVGCSCPHLIAKALDPEESRRTITRIAADLTG